MTEARDTRSQAVPMPPAAAAIGQELVDQLKPMLDRAFDAIIALPGNPAERENDALSIVAHIGSFVGLQMTARLMKLKRIDPESAMAITLHNFSDRMCAEVAILLVGASRG